MASINQSSDRLRKLRAHGIQPVKYERCVLDQRCIQKSEQTAVSLLALRMELKNYMDHGQAKHGGDWYHEWQRTRQGTLSWDF